MSITIIGLIVIVVFAIVFLLNTSKKNGNIKGQKVNKEEELEKEKWNR